MCFLIKWSWWSKLTATHSHSRCVRVLISLHPCRHLSLPVILITAVLVLGSGTSLWFPLEFLWLLITNSHLFMYLLSFYRHTDTPHTDTQTHVRVIGWDSVAAFKLNCLLLSYTIYYLQIFHSFFSLYFEAQKIYVFLFLWQGLSK